MDEARKRFAGDVISAMEELNVSVADMAALLKVKKFSVYEVRSKGLTPKSRYFLPLCEELGLDPRAYFPDHECDPGVGENETLAEALRSGRRARRLSAAGAARLLGISETTIRHYEDGYHIPPEDKLARLCRLYGLDRKVMRALREKAAAARAEL